jgi:hypothetical protein
LFSTYCHCCDIAVLTSQVIILIDALDEADPPEQQKPGFSGCVMAAGNKALRLLVTCFAAKLPKNIR